jgi:hypothetical protein
MSCMSYKSHKYICHVSLDIKCTIAFLSRSVTLCHSVTHVMRVIQKSQIYLSFVIRHQMCHSFYDPKCHIVSQCDTCHFRHTCHNYNCHVSLDNKCVIVGLFVTNYKKSLRRGVKKRFQGLWWRALL